MFLLNRLAGMLQIAIRHAVAPNDGAPIPATVRTPAVRAMPAMGRARVPLANMPRVWEVDEPTKVLIWPGDPGVNDGARYVRPEGVIGRHRSPDLNQMPARFTRQRVA